MSEYRDIVIAGGGMVGVSLANPDDGSYPVGLARYTLRLPDFDWKTTSSEHFRIHYLPGSVAEKQIDTLLKRNEGYLKAQLEHMKEGIKQKMVLFGSEGKA